MIAVLAPGQGSQTPGMLTPWLELDGVGELIGQFSEIAGFDLLRLGTTADAEEIRDTAVTQPLIVALGLVTAAHLNIAGTGTGTLTGTLTAGHSIGEVTAAAIAGALTPQEAMRFAARRGAEMAAACALVPTSMAAVLGGDADEVVAALTAVGLTAANRNAAGQIVAAGDAASIAALIENPPAGARVRPLQVAGAFHTTYMAPAEERLRAVAADFRAADPTLTLLSNADGASVSSGQDVVDRLVAQVTRPVRWDLCLDTMRKLGVQAVIELPPAGTLTGIAKRELPGVQLLALKSPADLDAAHALLAAQ